MRRGLGSIEQVGSLGPGMPCCPQASQGAWLGPRPAPQGGLPTTPAPPSRSVRSRQASSQDPSKGHLGTPHSPQGFLP